MASEHQPLTRRDLLAAAALLAAGPGSAAEPFPELRRYPQTTRDPWSGGRSLDMGTVHQRNWPAKRKELHRRWLEALGPMPARRTVKPKVLTTERLADHLRTLIEYPSQPEPVTQAYVLEPLPESGRKKHPGLVCLHQTSDTTILDPVGLAGRETMHYALHQVRRGYVCIAPRNFLWSRPGVRYQQITDDLLKASPWKTGMAKMLWDAQRATDVLCAWQGVDKRRIGTIGHSLGGKEVLYLAAFDERIRAAVSCEGGIGTSFSNWNADWYLGKQINDLWFQGEHHEVLALIAPRAFLLIGGNSADGDKSGEYLGDALPAWRFHHAEERLGLMVHKHGHDYPPPGPERDLVQRWLDYWLKPRKETTRG